MPNPAAPTYVNHWTSAVGALAGILTSRGSRLSTDEVAVLSGHAFRFACTRSPEGAFGADAPSCFSAESALPLYAELGLRFAASESEAGAADFEETRRLALAEIGRSLQARRPVIAYGLQTAGFGIVFGIDDAALTVSSTMSAQYGGRLPLSQWPAPGRALPLRVFVLQKELNFKRGRALAAAISFAVRYGHFGESGWLPGGALVASGLEAYSLWSELLDGEALIAPSGHAMCIQALIEGRGEAARVLEQEARGAKPAQAGPLRRAAAAYRDEGLELSRMATLFPYPNGGDVRSPGGRRLGAAMVRRCAAAEASAIAALDAYSPS